MKNLLILAIVLMTFSIGCNVESNTNTKEPNYSISAMLIPFLALAIYGVTHLKELEKWS